MEKQRQYQGVEESRMVQKILGPFAVSAVLIFGLLIWSLTQYPAYLNIVKREEVASPVMGAPKVAFYLSLIIGAIYVAGMLKLVRPHIKVF